MLLNDTKWQAHTHTHGIMLRVLLAFAHHLKLDDLNSISCLLSMRLCRHANNRKFALTGIDQQPLIVSHDSEVSHDSSASDRAVRRVSFYNQEHCVISGVVRSRNESQLEWRHRTSLRLQTLTDLPALWVLFDPLMRVYIGRRRVNGVSHCWWATNIWLCRTGLSLQDTHADPFPSEGCPFHPSWEEKRKFTPA